MIGRGLGADIRGNELLLKLCRLKEVTCRVGGNNRRWSSSIKHRPLSTYHEQVSVLSSLLWVPKPEYCCKSQFQQTSFWSKKLGYLRCCLGRAPTTFPVAAEFLVSMSWPSRFPRGKSWIASYCTMCLVRHMLALRFATNLFLGLKTHAARLILMSYTNWTVGTVPLSVNLAPDWRRERWALVSWTRRRF